MVEEVTESQLGRGLTSDVIRRWRKDLNSNHSRASVDDFVHRHQATLENLVARELMRRAEEGRVPTGAHAFAAYTATVSRGRRIDTLHDDEILTRLSALIDADFATGRYTEQSVLNNLGREYVLARAEAMFLRVHGWDAVPLLVASPALAVVVDQSVIAVRTNMGSLSFHPHRRGTLNHLYTHVREAEVEIENLLEELGLEPNTKERLMHFALTLWTAARTKIATRQGLKRSTP